MPRTATPAALIALALFTAAAAPRTAFEPDTLPSTIEINPDDPLPITEITLYRSGVGSFIREGSVNGDAQVQLRFRTDQVNDILKSMVVLDLDGGQVEGATYGSKEPLQRRLGSFAIDLSNNPDTASLLAQLRGAQVRITTNEGQTEGAVLGIEQRQRAGEQTVVTVPVVSLVTPTGIKAFEIDRIRGFEILDTQLANELAKALTALAEHRADNTKSVALGFHGQGQRRVAVSYVQEAPVWKTSYRLVLPDDITADSATIQGWAIVENTTDDDWNDVRLSLVAGQPVSFEMDLYQPLFVDRPDVAVPVGVVAAPRAYEKGLRLAELGVADGTETLTRDRGLMDDEMQFRARAAPPASAGLQAMPMRGAELSKAMADAARASAASAGAIGEVFQYTLDVPVTVGRQQSAMLPILSAGIDAERVSIFSAADGINHPMRGVKVTNSSDLQLMPGPIAVYDGTSYAGDAQIGHVSPGDDRLIAYAVDLDVTARVEHTARTNVQKVRIVRGVLELTSTQERETVYSFDNADEADGRALVLEHPKMPGWDYQGAQPDERADVVDRFRVKLDAGATRALKLVQTHTDRTRHELLSYNRDSLLSYVRSGAAPQGVVEAFGEVQKRQDAVVAQERTLQALRSETEAIGRDQARVRENIGAINASSDLYARYVTKLTEQEDRLEAIERERAAAQERLNAARQELESFLQNLSVG